MRVGMALVSGLGLVVAGCAGSDDDDVVETGEEEIVWIDTLGDFSCYTAGDEWNTQSVDADKQVPITISVPLLDFEQETPVADAAVDVWFADAVSGPADYSATSDVNGDVTLEIDACSPFTYRTSTPPELDATKDTYEAHQIYIEDDTSDELNSVSTTTYAIIPSVLGITVDLSKGVISGRSYDCTGEDYVEGARVRVVEDASGTEPEGVIVRYFVDEFPDRDQPWTSEDGLWVAMNVPDGRYRVEMIRNEGGTETIMGATVLDTRSDSINISNIYAGLGMGVRYPDECLAE